MRPSQPPPRTQFGQPSTLNVRSLAGWGPAVRVALHTGSAFGPFIAGPLADASGGYGLPFTLAGFTGIAMAGVVLIARAPVAPRNAT